MKKLNNSRTLLLILIIGAASFAIQGCTPSAASAPAGQPTAPTNPENPVAAVQDTGIYKALTSLGFDISTEKVEAIDGQYQPKTGDITSLSYRQVDNAAKLTYNYALDRENSTENNLIYKGSVYDESEKESYDSANSTISVNSEEKSVDIYDSITDTRRKFTLNDDGTLTVFEDNGVAQATCQMTVGDNKSLYGPRGETYADIKIKLAE